MAEELGPGGMVDACSVQGLRDDHMNSGVVGQSGVWGFLDRPEFCGELIAVRQPLLAG